MKFKFAFVEGVRREAQPGLSGICPYWGDAMIARCGELRVWHWAHRGTRNCDHWWETETEWHRAWKNLFPKGWQEIIHTSKHGEKHIADVKTERGVVLEFQYSYLRPDERAAREVFYQNMVWVVNGRRRKHDRKQFFASLGAPINHEPLIFSVRSDECALLRDWKASRVLVYFDFGDSEPGDPWRFDEPVLWRLSPSGPDGRLYLSPVSKASFLDVHLTGRSSAVERTVDKYISIREALIREAYMRQASWSPPLASFERYWARRQRARRRF